MLLKNAMARVKEKNATVRFDKISIGLASPESILAVSRGEVAKPETINYRTHKPERDGLFCERIFGPVKDYECACGKYKRIRYKGIVCDRCGVEVTEKKVRRERVGHINLVVPIAHIWYFRSLPNKIGYLLGLPSKKLDMIIYYERYIVIQPGIAKSLSGEPLEKMELLTEEEYLDIMETLPVENQYLEDTDPNKFVAKMGAEALYDLLHEIDLDALSYDLRHKANTETSKQRKTEALKRLQVVEAFRDSQKNRENLPEWMIMKVIPVIPPELRPLVPLDGGRFATSDLNDLYRRVIIRNNRLKRLIEIKAPDVILRNEKRMLQESVDSLFDNTRKSSAVKTDANRPLKSLSDSLKGKQGRFRQNLLGKRVDYSARSVIVVGPELKLFECGLPKNMAAELYKPFVIRKLIERGIVKTVKSAKRIIDKKEPVVWDILENVIKGHPVLLNRAPTLHRLGIQAFQPKLIEGKAIRLHPLVCTAFNADFDGDQMAVHLPLSPEAQAEARILMLSSNNILKPSDGRPVAVPSQDMIIGLYHLTTPREGEKNEGHAFSSIAEALMAMDRHEIELYTKVKVRLSGDEFVAPEGWEAPEGYTSGGPVLLECTVGQILFNQTLPKDYPWFSGVADKKGLGKLINDLAEKYPMDIVARTLDNLKNAGFYWASRSGVTVAVSDIATPATKPAIMERYEKQASAIEDEFDVGMIGDDERREELIKIWTEATDTVAEAMRENLSDNGGLNTIYRMVTSGARGNWMQVRQIAGIRGLVSNPKGEIMPRPIKSSYREGLSVLEYFIATHGARKGLADTALRTANSGYLTRRLVDVSQDVIVREHDCGTRRGLVLPLIDADGNLHPDVETSIHGRTLAIDVKDSDGNVIASAGEDVSDVLIEKLFKAGVKELRVRSVLTCESSIGVCALCYGRSMASNVLVDIGEAVGIIAAQSIGEPGTQLTMRTFHTGGVASADDITQGLPRIQELFEARTPKGVAPISEVSGRVTIEDTEKSYKIVVTPDDGSEPQSYTVLRRAASKLQTGDHVQVGDQLAAGAVDPKEVLRIRGPREAQKHLVSEVQGVYKSQGVEIHDKHVEVIVRQMLRRVTVIESGDTELLPGELVDNIVFQKANRKALVEGKKPAAGRPEMMGITKASLATESWLSAASFQETTRVLTQAAMEAKTDPLLGLKENVIIGKLVPAGTGLARYNDIEVEPSQKAREEQMQAFDGFGYQSAFTQLGEDPYPYANSGYMAVPLDEYGRGLE